MADTNELVALIQNGREGLAVEFKRSMSWSDAATKGKIIKAALGFANLRDGGVLVLGIEQKNDSPLHQPIGMAKSDFESFTQDGVSAAVNAHATPYIDLSVEHVAIGDSVFVAIVIRQFSDYPVICSKDFPSLPR